MACIEIGEHGLAAVLVEAGAAQHIAILVVDGDDADAVGPRHGLAVAVTGQVFVVRMVVRAAGDALLILGRAVDDQLVAELDDGAKRQPERIGRGRRGPPVLTVRGAPGAGRGPPGRAGDGQLSPGRRGGSGRRCRAERRGRPAGAADPAPGRHRAAAPGSCRSAGWWAAECRSARLGHWPGAALQAAAAADVAGGAVPACRSRYRHWFRHPWRCRRAAPPTAAGHRGAPARRERPAAARRERALRPPALRPAACRSGC